MPDHPVARRADGSVHLTAFCVLLDIALATTARLKLARGARQATVHLHAQFTGEPLRGALLARAAPRGHTVHAAREALAAATVSAGGTAVCHATGNFIALPPPAGVQLAPLPWERGAKATPPALGEADLDDEERAVLTACDAALERTRAPRAFIERFWGALPERTRNGARCNVPVGPHHGNRVGHVQGGLLLGLAAVTACAAVPRHPGLSALAAWFIGPGRGPALRIRSARLHEGRSFAAVRTEVRNADGSRVLELVSHHAA